jgi:hypothetical protein
MNQNIHNLKEDKMNFDMKKEVEVDKDIISIIITIRKKLNKNHRKSLKEYLAQSYQLILI